MALKIATKTQKQRRDESKPFSESGVRIAGQFLFRALFLVQPRGASRAPPARDLSLRAGAATLLLARAK